MADTSSRDQNNAPGQEDMVKPAVVHADRAAGVPGAEPPLETRPAHASERDRTAAGFTSIWETVHRGATQMGVRRSLRTLLKLNQKDGFDCPSCAWPDPDGERKTFEFCENGAKAVASEATKERCTPEFFAAHSLDQLLRQRDSWLERQGRLTQPMLLERESRHYRPISWDDAFELIAEELHVAPERKRWLVRAALLHDLGKLGVSNEILDKPGKLDAAEWESVRSHPGRGAEILSRMAAFAPLAKIALEHHERLDGKGYPQQLSGEAINLETRIVTTADIFDALTADRPYRKAMSAGEALAIMRADVGTAIDARCFAALERSLDRLQLAAA